MKAIWFPICVVFLTIVLAPFSSFLCSFLGLRIEQLFLCKSIIIFLLSWVFIFLDYKATIKELDDL